jgi:hypothetical protein
MGGRTRVLALFVSRRTAPVLISAHRASLGRCLPREQRAKVNGALLERREALFPRLIEHELARLVETHVIAGDLMLLSLGPGKLAWIEVEPERLQDALQRGLGSRTKSS